MDKESDNVGDFSISMSRALDEIGLNEVTVQKRREDHAFFEKLNSVCASIDGEKDTAYMFGSQSEGTTTPALGSDHDSLCCFNDFTVIQDLSEWTPGKINLLMLQENTAPGYCRLQLMKWDKPETEVTPLDERYAYDGCGRVIMKNSGFGDCLQDIYGEKHTNGPALTVSFSGGSLDYVPALTCTQSFKVANLWARRHRRGDWPPQDLIEQVVKEPAFVVPVGHKLSQTPDLEWRISTSLAERCLMYSLNIVQIKCYVLLKMLVKEFVTPFVDTSVSSYHCKTVLFYCIENTESDFWRENNLLHYVTRCLRLLCDWVSKEVCPHYIIAGANLLDRKVTPQNKNELIFRLQFLIQNPRHALQNICSDKLGLVLTEKTRTCTIPNHPLLKSLPTLLILGQLEFRGYAHVANLETHLQTLYFTRTLPSVIAHVKKFLHELNDRLGLRYASTLENKALEQFIEILSRFYGSLLSSSALCRYDRIEQEAIKMLESGATHDISARLKLASVLYCNGDLEKVVQLLQELEQHVSTNFIRSACGCTKKSKSPIQQFFHLPCSKSEMYSRCVTFSLLDMHCAPYALRYELFGDVGDDYQRRNPVYDKWMVLAVVDGVPFLYFLQYITYRQLGKTQLLKEAFQHLEQCITEGAGTFEHSETALNLLGQCYEMEHEVKSALVCYRRSLDIQPRNNAANWLVSILIHKCISQQSVDG